MKWDDKNLVGVLKKGGLAIMPTDTIYGIVGQAKNISTVNRIYNLKRRNPEKPCIILIGDIEELEKFSIVLSPDQRNKLKEYWSFDTIQEFHTNPVSVIFDCKGHELSYLHRSTETLAFRLPSSKPLRSLLLKTGPLIAPSANPEGLPPAKNILESKKYFGNSIDLYLDGGEISGNASRVVKLNKDGSVDIIRA
jgi:L-threonylcarbamoyladenylate synthase